MLEGRRQVAGETNLALLLANNVAGALDRAVSVVSIDPSVLPAAIDPTGGGPAPSGSTSARARKTPGLRGLWGGRFGIDANCGH